MRKKQIDDLTNRIRDLETGVRWLKEDVTSNARNLNGVWNSINGLKNYLKIRVKQVPSVPLNTVFEKIPAKRKK